METIESIALERYIDPKEAARIANVPVQTVLRAVEAKQLTHLRIGPRTIRFQRRWIAEWTAARTH